MNPHQPAPTTFSSLVGSLWRNRGLILQLIQRDVVGRYNGSIFGLAWSFFNPLLLLTVYALVFTVAFKAQWPGGGEVQGKGYFAIMLFTGMVVHGFFAECLTRSPGVIVGNTSYVKKVVFPIEVLPVVAVGSALFHSLISLSVLLVGVLALRQSLPATALLVPLVLLPLVLLAQGVTWLLAALGVYLRDIAHSTGLLAPQLRQDIPLVVVGKAGWGCEDVVAQLTHGDGGALRWLRYVPDADMLPLLHQASALVFPSLHEGFGLPVLEAFAARTPVISANTTALAEIAPGGGALMVNPHSSGELAEAMRYMAQASSPQVQQLQNQGVTWAQKFTWQATQQGTLAAYQQLLSS